jgi:ribonuclease HII
MKILGIDESGKGPVCGPMILCGYLVEKGNLADLKKLGVKDSKLLSAKKRQELFPKIKELSCSYKLIKIDACEIDLLRTESNLNLIEIEKMQHLINKFKPDRAIIDAPEANTKAFAKKISAGLDCKCEIIAENFADKNHIEVAAASVLAKVTRDREIEKLHKIHGNFGSGYTSDPVTIGFLKNWLKMNKEFPLFVRNSWITARAMKAEKEQTKIGKFIK